MMEAPSINRNFGFLLLSENNFKTHDEKIAKYRFWPSSLSF